MSHEVLPGHLIRSEYVTKWNDLLSPLIDCPPITRDLFNTLIQALRERSALVSGTAPALRVPSPGKGRYCHPLLSLDFASQSVNDWRQDVITQLVGFVDPEPDGKGTTPILQFSPDGDAFFKTAGIGEPGNEKWNIWTNVPDRDGLIPEYKSQMLDDRCYGIYREHLEEIIKAIKTMNRIQRGSVVGRAFVTGVSDGHFSGQAALDQAQARAAAFTPPSTSGGHPIGYNAGFTSGGVPEAFTYTVRYVSGTMKVDLAVVEASGGEPSQWFDLPASGELEYDNLTMIIKFDTTGITNNGNGPIIDEGPIVQDIPFSTPDDVPHTENKIGVTYNTSDGTGVIELGWRSAKSQVLPITGFRTAKPMRTCWSLFRSRIMRAGVRTFQAMTYGV